MAVPKFKVHTSIYKFLHKQPAPTETSLQAHLKCNAKLLNLKQNYLKTYRVKLELQPSRLPKFYESTDTFSNTYVYKFGD
ncbi:hypothetical protein RN001_010897 [Aquatica leii]|uniref:Uncharacterized protein n=1 Tax=Aquatica leii TaxID=1421715 RepID=A0AAN7PAL9_9COLE|nr:hypothetical protein RN001_010897 [Aquatica leii]